MDTFHFPNDIDDTSTDYSFDGARRGGDIRRTTTTTTAISRSGGADVGSASYSLNGSSSRFNHDQDANTNTSYYYGEGIEIPLVDKFFTSNITASIMSNVDDVYDQTNNNLTCQFKKHDWLEEKFYLISICGTTIAILGIFANVTTALVLTRPSMRTPNNLYLTTLAIFDTCLLITAIFLYSVEYIFEYTDDLPLYKIWLTYVPIVYALSHIAQTGSVYVTVAVTIERYIAVVHPEKSKIFCTQKGAGSAIFWVFCFAVLFNCTKFFELEVLAIENCTEFAAYSLEPSFLQSNDLYMTVYSLWITQITMVFAPFLVLLIFNTIIALTIRQSFKRLRWVQQGPKRNELKEKSKEATYVLIVIVLIFLICNLWGFVISLMERIYGAHYLTTHMRDFYTFSREAVNFLTIVNSSINFVIYCIFGKDFRKELVHVYGCCKCSITLFIPIDDKFTANRFYYEDNNKKQQQELLTQQQQQQQLCPLNRRRLDSNYGSLFRLGELGDWFRRRFSSSVSHQAAETSLGEYAKSVVYTNDNANGERLYRGMDNNGCAIRCKDEAPKTSSSVDTKSLCSLNDNSLTKFLPSIIVSATNSMSRRSSRNSTPTVTIFYSDENVTWL